MVGERCTFLRFVRSKKSKTKMNTLKVVQLKEMLKARNLSTAGNKCEMVKRLFEAGVSAEELAPTVELLESGEDTEYQVDTRQLGAAGSARPVQTAQPSPEEAQTAQGAVSRVPEVERLRRERDLAAREADVLRRELEMLRMSSRSGGDLHVRAEAKKWKDVKDLIGEYDGSNWDFEQWEKQMRRLLTTYHLDEHSAKALVCSRLTGKALKWYHSRADCVELSHYELLQELKKMYGQRKDKLALRRDLEARVWNANETFADYLHDKVTLANRVPIEEEEIISYVIEGIPNQELRTQAKVQRYQTIDAMLAAFADVPPPRETYRRPFIQRRGEPTGKSRPQAKEPRKPREAGPPKCYNCDEVGHFASSCKKPKRVRGSCFKCGKYGHQASQCSPPSGDVNCVVQQRGEEDFRRAVELHMNNEDGNFRINLNALLDSGSPISFVKERCVPRGYIIRDSKSDRFRGINNSELEIVGRAKATIITCDREYDIMLRVVPDKTMQSAMILGRDFLKAAKLTLNNDAQVNNLKASLIDEKY